jgi:phosphoglycolate phosphatase
LLKNLKLKGIELHVATSKLEKYAIKVLEIHNILRYFTLISGATYKGSGADKSYLIQQVLKKRNFVRPEKFLMIGDKRFDIEGAKSAGIDSLGVLYGFGTEQELTNAGADYIIGSVEELKCFLLKT